MKHLKSFAFVVSIIAILMLSACSSDAPQNNISAHPSNNSDFDLPETSEQIYLYGEQHGVESIINKELELWREYYHNENMRHLFVELPYYTAEFMNLWMQADDDEILDSIFIDSEGTAGNTAAEKEFYQKIKNECPETVFHGTDVGHQYDTTGKRFLEYLQANGLGDSEQYSLTVEAIEQGERFYENDDFVYRENKMTENFIREFENLKGESVMGIYGGAHVGLDAMEYSTQSIPCMANQLKEKYGDAIHSDDISWLALDIEPLRTETLLVDGKEYEALYFGEEDISSFGLDFVKREFWRLENAYEDFKESPKTDDVLPYNNYPMLIEIGQVFVIDYTKNDGTVERMYYRSDGNEWNGMQSTEQFVIK